MSGMGSASTLRSGAGPRLRQGFGEARRSAKGAKAAHPRRLEPQALMPSAPIWPVTSSGTESGASKKSQIRA